MEKEITIYQPEGIEKKYENTGKNPNENEENSHNFRKLIAEIIVEIMIKKRKNGCDRVHKNK
ncbi:MAG: hypothetical protein ACHQIM_09440 [Sphingobacteriales bacterium]